MTDPHVPAKSELRPPNVSGGDECCGNCCWFRRDERDPFYGFCTIPVDGLHQPELPPAIAATGWVRTDRITRLDMCELWDVPAQQIGAPS